MRSNAGRWCQATAIALLLALVATSICAAAEVKKPGMTKKLGSAKPPMASDKGAAPKNEVVPKLSEQPAPPQDQRKLLPVEKMAGKHVVVEMPAQYFAKLNDKKGFIRFLDAGFEKEAELMTPKSDTIVFRTDALNCWGLGGGGQVTVTFDAMEDVINQFNNSNIVFGVLHEMGHCFDQPGQQRWYKFPHWLNGETWANIPLTFAFEQMLTTNSNYRIDWDGARRTGMEFNDMFYVGKYQKYLDSSNNWVNIGIDELHAFHMMFIRRYGWDVYKKWFRCAYTLEGMGSFPDGGFENPERVVVNCAMLSEFSGCNLVPEFKRFRFPVTDESVAKAARKFKLKQVFELVEDQFAREVTEGRITLDPAGIRVAATNMANGASKVTIQAIRLKGGTVRYTLDGREPSGSSMQYMGPLCINRPTLVKAALFFGKKTPKALISVASKIVPPGRPEQPQS